MRPIPSIQDTLSSHYIVIIILNLCKNILTSSTDQTLVTIFILKRIHNLVAKTRALVQFRGTFYFFRNSFIILYLFPFMYSFLKKYAIMRLEIFKRHIPNFAYNCFYHVKYLVFIATRCLPFCALNLRAKRGCHVYQGLLKKFKNFLLSSSLYTA